MEQSRTARVEITVSRRWPLVSSAVTLLLVVALGVLIAIRASPLELDTEWMEEIVEHRSLWWEVPSLLMNYLGGGWFALAVVPVAIVVALVLAKRRIAALYFAIGAALSAGLVQLLKGLFGRARPEDILVASDFGSFPSGHVANAATIAVTLAIIIGRLWVWIAGAAYTVLMALSRTYLGAHWVSDTVGGLLLGAAVAIIIWAPFSRRLRAERNARSR